MWVVIVHNYAAHTIRYDKVPKDVSRDWNTAHMWVFEFVIIRFTQMLFLVGGVV